MARSKGMSVQKRLRESKKAEAAALKRQDRSSRERPASGGGGAVAAREDLEGYGVITSPAEDSTQP